MDRYQLVKLVEWAGALKTRKAMQKVVYLLQACECPFDVADFDLHHFGPYSSEVAQLTDELVQIELLEERRTENFAGSQFEYSLTARATRILGELEETPAGKKERDRILRFKEQAQKLLKRPVKELEVAATVVYFRQRGHEWDASIEKTCKFKALSATSDAVRRAEVLARSVTRQCRNQRGD